MGKTKNKSFIRHMMTQIRRTPVNYLYYQDLFEYLRALEVEDWELAHEKNRELREKIVEAMELKYNLAEFFALYKKTLLFEAKYDLDSYLQYLEADRKPEERFYLPRRTALKPIVDGIQALADDELDELFISQPPRTGKTTLLLFAVTWLMGRNSEGSILYSAYSDVITKAFYNGNLEVLNDPDTYLWGEVFPESKIVQTNAQDETINLDRKKRYPSLTCRSIFGTLNGACDCDYFLISDDLIGGIEEALNPDRLFSTWSKVDNNLLTRAKEKAKILWVGTRWSVVDPAGIRIDLLENDERFKDRRYKIINVPALDENDESNFDYKYGVGYSTKMYHERRASFERRGDLASWQAQYMGEPIEREGTVFDANELRYYIDLPLEQPDRVVMAVDPSFGGSDYTASPVCAVYGDDLYVLDVVYTNEDKTVSQKEIVDKIEKYGVTAVQIEANKMTEMYKDGIKELLNERGIRVNLTTKPAPPTRSKEDRILASAPDIKEHVIFKEKRDRVYSQFMNNMLQFKLIGKNKHDDAPDSMAMLIDMVLGKRNVAKVFKRVF